MLLHPVCGLLQLLLGQEKLCAAPQIPLIAAHSMQSLLPMPLVAGFGYQQMASVQHSICAVTQCRG